MLATNILEKLKQQPDALLILEKLNAFFQHEKEERQQFHLSLDDDLNAEFINGKIINQPLVAWEHLTVSASLSTSLHGYVKKEGLGIVGVEKVMINFTRNDYQPSICFFSTAKAQTFFPDQILFPVPDFIVEIICPVTEKIARSIKLQDYVAHGVPEYWIINPIEQTVEQYLLEEDDYKLHVKLLKEGTIHAKAIAGYSIDLKDIF